MQGRLPDEITEEKRKSHLKDPIKSVCRNFDGAYECLCRNGYEHYDERTCHRIDACNQHSCPVDSNCYLLEDERIPEEGQTHECLCNRGFEQNENGCMDIDECLEGWFIFVIFY